MDYDKFQLGVITSQNNSGSLIMFQINEANSTFQSTNVGQFVKSFPFELNFPNSIGKSKWVSKIFLNGQYCYGRPTELVNIYLEILDCEHHSAEIKIDAEFTFKGRYASISKSNQRLCFKKPRTKWFDTKLISVGQMLANWSQIVEDDTLTISLHLKELSRDKELFLPEKSKSNFLDNTKFVDKFATKDLGIPEVCSRSQRNLNRFSDIYPEASGRTSRLSNMNSESSFMETEYSDDEDAQKKEEPKVDNFLSSVGSAIKRFWGKSNK